MNLQVVGAGIGRTGTHTLKIVLEKLLGGPCHHMAELFAHPEQVPLWTKAANGEPLAEWGSVLDGYLAMVDWPGAAFYLELADANPDALVLLSIRKDADEWWRSASRTIFPAMQSAPDNDPWADMVRTLIGSFTDITDEAAAKAAYERHNAEVRSTIPSDRLLEWRATDGWGPLCNALGVKVPDEPFPVTNTTEEWLARSGNPPSS